MNPEPKNVRRSIEEYSTCCILWIQDVRDEDDVQSISNRISRLDVIVKKVSDLH